MGLMTRFRAKLHSCSSDSKLHNEKPLNSVCLLSLAFLVPCLARGSTFLTLSALIAFIFPVLFLANYQYPLMVFRSISAVLDELLLHAIDMVKTYLKKKARVLILEIKSRFFEVSAFLQPHIAASLVHLKQTAVHFITYSQNVFHECLFQPTVNSLHSLGFQMVQYLNTCISSFKSLCLQPLLRILYRMYLKLHHVEESFLKLRNISILTNQIIFLVACEKAIEPSPKVTALYSLMFYNVIAYCVSYVKELICKEDWSLWIHVASHSDICHLAMSTTKIVLEWTKAVTFIITVVLMLLVFGLEQGLQYYHPTLLYTSITLLYYCATEKVFIEFFPAILVFLQLPCVESLEALWAPVILKFLTAGMSTLVSLTLLTQQHYNMMLIISYFNVFLRAKELYSRDWRELNDEKTNLYKFRYATKEELAAFEDVCAICLGGMSLARITPCHHLFHGDCLRKCLKTSNLCPICKRELKFD